MLGMSENGSVTGDDATQMRAAFDRLLADLRPKLHRYCARMTGSVVDGEDVLQEAMIKAIEAHPSAGPIANPEGWLFRIAHNTALDLLRRRARIDAMRSDEDVTMIADPDTTADQRRAAAVSLGTFMRLPVAQRSSVILKDVLGYSIEEITVILDGATVPGVKAALHRGRTRLRELADEPDPPMVPQLSEREQTLLAAYVDRFNARDFDAVRDMLADEVRLELVARTRMNGRAEVSRYFGNYAKTEDWRFVLGFADGRPAVLAFDPRNRAVSPSYFVLLRWEGNRLVGIRDFRYARYATEGAELVTLGGDGPSQ
jgi:RNA polymerase sigma-70 factor (ECF subfamily)